jgi:hypothetical protein
MRAIDPNVKHIIYRYIHRDMYNDCMNQLSDVTTSIRRILHNVIQQFNEDTLTLRFCKICKYTQLQFISARDSYFTFCKSCEYHRQFIRIQKHQKIVASRKQFFQIVQQIIVAICLVIGILSQIWRDV